VQDTASTNNLLASRGFSLLGRGAQPALPALLELAQSKTGPLRNRAYGCLRDLQLGWETLWPALVPVLHHADPAVRVAAAAFLCELFPEQARKAGVYQVLPPLTRKDLDTQEAARVRNAGPRP
jgi:HEAT repeat protein